jgi:hypothetical protein
VWFVVRQNVTSLNDLKYSRGKYRQFETWKVNDEEWIHVPNWLQNQSHYSLAMMNSDVVCLELMVAELKHQSSQEVKDDEERVCPLKRQMDAARSSFGPIF